MGEGGGVEKFRVGVEARAVELVEMVVLEVGVEVARSRVGEGGWHEGAAGLAVPDGLEDAVFSGEAVGAAGVGVAPGGREGQMGGQGV